MFEYLNGLGGMAAALLVMRVGVGAFFAISGYHKLFNPGRRETLRKTFEECGVPFIPVCMWLVPATEFLGGLGVVVGFLTLPASVGLVVILVVALMLDGRKRVDSWNPIDFADRVDDYLYLPETVYLIALAVFIAGGAGALSIDALLF